MYDRRVVRGNTYAQHIIPTVSMKYFTVLDAYRFAFLSTIICLKCELSSAFDRRLSQTLLKHKDNRRSGGEPLLENELRSSSDPGLLRPCRAENTLMYKQVRHLYSIHYEFINVLLETKAFL